MITHAGKVGYFEDVRPKDGDVRYYCRESEPWQPSMDGWIPDIARPRPPRPSRAPARDGGAAGRMLGL